MPTATQLGERDTTSPPRTCLQQTYPILSRVCNVQCGAIVDRSARSRAPLAPSVPHFSVPAPAAGPCRCTEKTASLGVQSRCQVYLSQSPSKEAPLSACRNGALTVMRCTGVQARKSCSPARVPRTCAAYTQGVCDKAVLGRPCLRASPREPWTHGQRNSQASQGALVHARSWVALGCLLYTLS